MEERANTGGETKNLNIGTRAGLDSPARQQISGGGLRDYKGMASNCRRWKGLAIRQLGEGRPNRDADVA
jgi:hypothetical protein